MGSRPGSSFVDLHGDDFAPKGNSQAKPKDDYMKQTDLLTLKKMVIEEIKNEL